MQKELDTFFAIEGIDCYNTLPFSACTVTKPYLYQNYPTPPQSVVMVAVPYATDATCDGLSRYAVAKDYHLYFKGLWERAVTYLKATLPQFWFCGFADHSPIAEVSAAVAAGLGVLGDNHLLITKKYGSYVFLGALLSDCPYTDTFVPKEGECLHCGACLRACPSKDNCLSAITQKKKDLTEKEIACMREHHTAWGCDICQEVCPMNRAKKKSTIPFFSEDCLTRLSARQIAEMDETAFQSRAFAWRGKECILRNLRILEESE